jgi:cysteine desulfurase/selenocysteine lyase
MEMALDKVRSHFPVLDRKVYGKDLVYLDNAATMQRPVEVIDLWNKISSESNANIHRAVHILADEATTAYEAAREEVRRFIGASSREEVILTAGTTASINLVASSFGEAFVKEGDEIIVSQAEHHSNIVPWQLMCARKGAELKVIPINDKGHLDLSVLDSLLSPKTRLVAVSHISNVLGIINPVKTIIEKCHSKGIPVLIDGAQGIVHTKVDMKELDCDFYVFSGHKIFAATGTGVLYGRKELLEAMPPYMGGGEMVGTVRFTGTSYAPLPMKFEAGTPNFASVATLKPALEYARSLDVEEVKKNEEAVRDFMLDALMADGQIRLFGVPDGDRAVKIPLFSFCVDGVHHEDLALILDKMGIAVRSGQMCAEPLMDRFGVTGMLRASFAPYNTLQEAEYFIKSLHRAINMLR